MTLKEVVQVMGVAPFQRDSKGVTEAYQWCRTVPGGRDQYLLVLFTNGFLSQVTNSQHDARYNCADTPARVNIENRPDKTIEHRLR